MIILLSCLAVAMCFTTLGLGFVNLASGPRMPAPVAEAKLAPPQIRATPAFVDEPVRQPVQPEAVKKKILEEAKKQIETGLADVGRQSRELDQAKRNLALQQETLAKSRNSLSELQKQSQEMARQASERTKSLNPVEIQRARVLADGEAHLADAKRQVAEADRREEEIRGEIHDKKTLFDPRRIFGAGKTGDRPQLVECVQGGVLLVPQGERISVGNLGSAPSFIQAVNGRYVVFLVRPTGYDAFVSARTAAEQHGATHLGYEPIGQDWQLKYR